MATESRWIDRLGGDPNVFNELLADGILRNSGILSGKRKFSLNFVGLLSIDNIAWFAFPKASKAMQLAEAVLVLQTIIEYRRKVVRSPVSTDFSATPDRLYTGTLVDTFTSLILWTLNYGFHHAPVDEARSTHEGIDWARTINATPAMHSNASVVYSSPISRIQWHRHSNLAEIQAHALLKMRRQLGVFADIIAPDVDDLWEQCVDILEDGNQGLLSDSINWAIQDHGELTNRDEDIELLGLLRDWFDQNWSAGRRLSAFGISAFHMVWEDMCAQAASRFGEIKSHAETASQPSYWVRGKEIKLTPQRPDILLVREGRVFLADAKWYLFDENSLPQTPDSIKQFAYELSMHAGVRVDANLLLLPSEIEEAWSVQGTLEMMSADGADTRFRAVSIIAINWHYLAQLYVERECFPEKFVFDMVATRSSDFAD